MILEQQNQKKFPEKIFFQKKIWEKNKIWENYLKKHFWKNNFESFFSTSGNYI